MVLGGWKVGEGVEPVSPGVGGSGWARRGGGGRGANLRRWRCPDSAKWSSGTPRRHCLPTAERAPRSRGREEAPWVRIGGSGGKVWSPQLGSGGCGYTVRNTWRSAAGSEKRTGSGCSVRKVLGGAQRRRARAAARSRASCDRSLKATSGGPKQTRGDWLLLPQRQPRLD